MSRTAASLSEGQISTGGLRVDPAALEGLSDADRDAVVVQLQALEAEFKANPLLGYNHPVLSRPHPKQMRFHAPRPGGGWPRTRLFIGGNRSGKTTATMVDSIIQCIDRDAVPDHLKKFKQFDPPFYCRMVGPDLTRWLEGVALQKFREWCPKDQLRGGSFQRGWEKQQIMLRFKNGSWVQFMSNDQDLDKFTGAALHRVVFDESPRYDIWSECRMRLIDYGGDEMFGLTPMDGMSNFLYDSFYEPWEKGALDESRARLVLVDMDDNPHLSEEDYEWALEGKPDEERDARKTGRFVPFEGLIYPEFSGRHVIPDEEAVPAGVEVVCGIDSGLRNPAVIYSFVDFDGTLVVFDEIAPKNWTIASVCKEIHNRNMRWEITPRFYVIDPAVRSKNPQTGRSDQHEFADHGIYTLPGQNDRRTGINKVKMRLEADPAKVLVQARCETLRNEFKKYRFRSQSHRSEDAPRDEPVKKDDHCFPAGTLVNTATGRRPIESICPGDLIWTRQGLFPAARAGLTRRDAGMCVLTFEDGRELTGTPGHPVYVADKGWTPLGSVRYGDIMWVWREGAKRSPGTESSSIATPTPSSRALATTSPPRQLDCTGPSGSSTTAQSQPDAMCITSMATRPTTTSRTSSAFRPEAISLGTGRPSGARSNGNGWSRSCVQPLPLGTAHRTDWRGIGSTQGACSVAESRDRTSAISAARDSRASSAATSASVPTAARPRGGEPPASMTLIESASGAAGTIGATDTPRPRLVPLRVVGNLPGRSAAVYNLTVLGPPEYFANGLLVHNCLDALRYVCMARPWTPTPDAPKPTDTMKDRLLRHHLRTVRRVPKPDNGFGPGVFQ